MVLAYGEKLAYRYRRVAWWVRWKEGLALNRKRVLRVIRERGLLVRPRRLRARHRKGTSGSEPAQSDLAVRDNGTQFTSSHFLERLGRLSITHRSLE